MTDQPHPPPPGHYPVPQSGYPPLPPALPKEAYTPWFARVVAYIVDYIPVFVLTGVVWWTALGTGDTMCTEYGDGYGGYCATSPSGLGLAIAVLAWLASLVYIVWNYGYRQGTTGSSIGKSVMKFQVVGERTGQPIGFGMSIVRQLAHVVDAVLCYVGYLWPLWDAKRQTFADKIMTTVCVPLNPHPSPPFPPPSQ